MNSALSLFPPSPIQRVWFENRLFFIKRDDKLDNDFSGNKARKLLFLLQENLPIKRLVSYGSNQSNAMYSLSVLAKRKKIPFIYYCEHIPDFLAHNPVGNYRYALENGMRISTDKTHFFQTHALDNNTSHLVWLDSDTLFVPEGGRFEEASLGIEQLANEICAYQHEHNITFDIFLPAGTGTTALFLRRYVNNVYTVACVGDEAYLKQQFFLLERNEAKHPIILERTKKYHFGKLYKEFLTMHTALKAQTHIEFDLLYDSLGWLTLLQHIERFKNPLLYIHQGGILGNESMLARYERKFYSPK